MDYTNIYASVTTAKDLFNKGEYLIQSIDSFIKLLIGNIDAGTNRVMNIYASGPKFRRKEMDYSEKNWSKVEEALLAGKISRLSLLYHDKSFWETEEDPIIADIGVISNYHYPDSSSSIELMIRTKHCRKMGIAQQSYINIVEYLFNNVEAQSGYITVDNISAGLTSSPHEEYCGLNYFIASQGFNKYFRGYFWGNFINKEHVEALGGFGNIVKEAPVYLVKELSDGGAFLQLTENIDNVTDDDLRALKKYFKPILPGRILQIEPEYYKNVRVITDEE